MARYVAGDHHAFDELFRRYQPMLERLLKPGLNHDTRDFVQQTFLNVHRARSSFTQGAAFRPWLLTIAFNLKRQHFRQKWRMTDVDVTTLEQGVSANAEVAYELRCVLSALAELPQREREAVELMCGGGYDTARAAEKLGISIGALKSLLHRARKELRPQVSERP